MDFLLLALLIIAAPALLLLGCVLSAILFEAVLKAGESILGLFD